MYVLKSDWKNYVGLILLCGMILGCSRSTDLEWNDEAWGRWAELSPGYFGSDGSGKCRLMYMPRFPAEFKGNPLDRFNLAGGF
jgi:hypothetical protein